MKQYRKKISVVVAFVAVVVVTVMLSVSYAMGKSDIELTHSSGKVAVQYVDKTPEIEKIVCPIALTEDEIFNKDNTSIFKGTVEKIQNIKVRIGKSAEYQAIATLKISEVYRGAEKNGDVVEVLLPNAIAPNIHIDGAGVISKMKVGTEGIFMPMKYDGSEVSAVDDAKLNLKDVCDYGLWDGQRYAFIQTERGLVYAEDAFPSLTNPTSLDDVKNYIQSQIDTAKK